MYVSEGAPSPPPTKMRTSTLPPAVAPSTTQTSPLPIRPLPPPPTCRALPRRFHRSRQLHRVLLLLAASGIANQPLFGGRNASHPYAYLCPASPPTEKEALTWAADAPPTSPAGGVSSAPPWRCPPTTAATPPTQTWRRPESLGRACRCAGRGVLHRDVVRAQRSDRYPPL